jgi:hypothetical protein
VIVVAVGVKVGVNEGAEVGNGTLGLLRERGFVMACGGGVPGSGGEAASEGSGGELGLLCMKGL